ncbi:replication initiation protein RepC [Rubellimicrobium aerolatum]|uniref:Replication initiation protein RepC n=1 Tax=Rubellimicrobium aerolatum TaxID=490979 RepID=A0ABW0SER5_9RHOB|nr:replication initiation protein RepC [Rubellimicrobium aerolatum]MBP1806926.1 replication initiation protein RepC [Rubellimicrobium aerolatum]
MLPLACPLAGEASRPVLPPGTTRSDVERLLPTIRRAFALSDACALTLLLLIQTTRPSDWTDPSVRPVCYASQTSLAERLGKTPRALRYDEMRLERAGLLVKTTAANGSRGRFAGGQVVQGLDLTPLADRVPQLLALAAQEEARRLHVQGLRRQCSAARRVFKGALQRLLERAPQAPATTEALALYAELPRRYDGMDVAALQSLLATLDKAVETCLAAFEMRLESSGVPEPGFRPSLQATREDNLESCVASADRTRPAGTPADARLVAAPRGAGRSREPQARDFQRVHKPHWLETFTPRRLYAACSDDMRMYLDAAKGSRTLPNELDLVRAAVMILPDLGINPSAWDEASEAMGDLAAALAVIVIDARRFDPVRPIRSPGGALRSFARLAMAGKLNLAGSLIGLVERERAESA